jgi:hypothetical protein
VSTSGFKKACTAVREIVQGRLSGGEADEHGKLGTHPHLDIISFSSHETGFVYLFHWPTLGFWRQKAKSTTKITSCRIGQVIKEDRGWLQRWFKTDVVPRGLEYLRRERGSTVVESVVQAARERSEEQAAERRQTERLDKAALRAAIKQKEKPAMALIDVNEKVTKIVESEIKLDRKQLLKLVEMGGGPTGLNGGVEITLEIQGEEDEFVTLFDKPGNRIVLRWRDERTTSSGDAP